MKRRTAQITVRFTKTEKEHLEKQAQLSGMAMEPFIRSLIAGSRIRERPPEFWKEVIYQLSAIGNNINQIAHNTNMADEASCEDIANVLLLMKEIKSEIRSWKNQWQ